MRQFSPEVEQQAQSGQRGNQQCQADSGLHGRWRNPALGTGTFGTEPVFAVAAFAEVEQIVDEVGGNLHEAGKEGTQQGRYFLKTSVAESKCATQQHGDEGSGQGLGAGGKHPCP